MPAAPKRTDNEITAHWSSFLRSKGMRLTTPRSVVMKAAIQMDHAFTAEELLSEARRIDGIISLPTIYRNLPLLVESGILRRLNSQDGTLRFTRHTVGEVEMILSDPERKQFERLDDDCICLRILYLARERGFKVERISLIVEGRKAS